MKWTLFNHTSGFLTGLWTQLDRQLELFDKYEFVDNKQNVFLLNLKNVFKCFWYMF